MIYNGHAETTTIGCMIFSHETGFDTPNKAIKHFITSALIAELYVNYQNLKEVDKIIEEKDLWAFLKKNPIQYNLIVEMSKWFNRQSHEFDHWEMFDQNGWNPWLLKPGKFLMIENVSKLIEDVLEPLEFGEEPNFDFNWDGMCHTVGSIAINKKT
jgi:hypothetical protein